MFNEKTDTEKVIRGYLSDINADSCMAIINVINSFGETDLESELEFFINAPADTIEDTNRSISIMNIVKKHSINLLNTLGIMTDNEIENEVPLSLIAYMVTTLATTNELDIRDSLYMLSINDEETSEFDFLMQLFALTDEIDISILNSFITNVSPSLIYNIIEVVKKNIEESDITPLKINKDLITNEVKVLDCLESSLTYIPDEVVHVLFNREYMDGINDIFINDLIKPIKVNIERYEDDRSKLLTYLYNEAVSLLFCFKINKEEDYVLTTLSIIQDYLEGKEIPDMHKKLIAFDNTCKTCGLYDLIFKGTLDA